MRDELSEQRAVVVEQLPLALALCAWLCGCLGLLRVAAQVARVRNQVAFMSLRPFVPCRALLRVAALIVGDCSQQPRLGAVGITQISFRGDLSLSGCGSANKHR